MADEAIIVELLGKNGKGDPVRYTCADATAIPKGTLLVLETPRAVVPHAAVDTPFVGIAAEEKTALDGLTSISVYTNGIFRLTLKTGGTPATIGDGVSLASDANTVELSTSKDNEKGWEVGYAMEDIAAATIGAIKIRK